VRTSERHAGYCLPRCSAPASAGLWVCRPTQSPSLLPPTVGRRPAQLRRAGSKPAQKRPRQTLAYQDRANVKAARAQRAAQPPRTAARDCTPAFPLCQDDKSTLRAQDRGLRRQSCRNRLDAAAANVRSDSHRARFPASGVSNPTRRNTAPLASIVSPSITLTAPGSIGLASAGVVAIATTPMRARTRPFICSAP
jgi:hypothetical protein